MQANTKTAVVNKDQVSSVLKNMLHDIVSRIVNDSAAVKIIETKEKDGSFYEIRVADPDVGKVIGRDGAVAVALRTIVKVIAMKNGCYAQIDVFSPRRIKGKGGIFNVMDFSDRG